MHFVVNAHRFLDSKSFLCNVIIQDRLASSNCLLCGMVSYFLECDIRSRLSEYSAVQRSAAAVHGIFFAKHLEIWIDVCY